MMLLCMRYWTISIRTRWSADESVNRRSISVRLSPSLLALFHIKQNNGNNIDINANVRLIHLTNVAQWWMTTGLWTMHISLSQ